MSIYAMDSQELIHRVESLRIQYTTNRQPLTRQKINYTAVKNQWDLYYKLTPTLEKKLYKLCELYNKDSKVDEVLDLDFYDRYIHLPLMVALHTGNKEKYKNEDYKKQLILYTYMSFMDEVFYRSDIYYGYCALPVILNNKYIVFILFDENKIHDIAVLTTENTQSYPMTTYYIRALKWKNAIHKTEFNKK